jgi:hypothetical protein
VLKGFKQRVVVVSGAAVLIGGMFVVVSGAADHHSHPGSNDNDNQEIHSISITASGGTELNSMNLSFSNLLPGAAQTVTLNYRNTGNAPEDVWVVYPNLTALSALNSLGQYGAVHLASSGAGAVGDVFDSQNLNDNHSACVTFTPSGCWPLTNQFKLASNFGSNATGSFNFSFEFASAYSQQPSSNSANGWNPFPVTGQQTVVSSDGSGAGLPYELVATQHGITPGQTETIFQTEPFGRTVPSSKSGSGFRDQLEVKKGQSPVTFVVTVPNSNLHVTVDGTITTVGGPLAPGNYSVSGTDIDAANNTGVWTYELTVNKSSDQNSNNHNSGNHH